MNRLLIAVIMFGVLFLVMTWLQGRFDASDHEKSSNLVRDYRAVPEGPTIPQAIIARHEGVELAELEWQSEILSTLAGYVRVSITVPAKNGQPKATYGFDVDRPKGAIHPSDPATIEILKSMSSTTSRTR